MKLRSIFFLCKLNIYFVLICKQKQVKKHQYFAKNICLYEKCEFLGVFGQKNGSDGSTILKLSTKRINVSYQKNRKRKFWGGSPSLWIVRFKMNKYLPLVSNHGSAVTYIWNIYTRPIGQVVPNICEKSESEKNWFSNISLL